VALLKRAKSLLAIGDITSARLLLERAADAQEGGSRADAGGGPMIRRCWAARICGASRPMRRRRGFGIRRPPNSVRLTRSGGSVS